MNLYRVSLVGAVLLATMSGRTDPIAAVAAAHGKDFLLARESAAAPWLIETDTTVRKMPGT